MSHEIFNSSFYGVFILTKKSLHDDLHNALATNKPRVIGVDHPEYETV